MGRHSKLTPAKSAQICEKVALGMSYKDAAAACGIGRSTFFEWKKLGREAKRKNKFRDFADALKKADLEFEEKHLKAIEDAAIRA